MSARRLFFALWPDQAMREALSAAVEGAIQAARGGRPVPLANLHVTLAFLGSVPESSVARLLEVARDVANGEDSNGDEASGAIAMRLDTIEHWRGAEILCAAASRMPPGAQELSGGLKSALLAAEFHPDLKPFRAHVTLARQVRRAPRGLGMPVVTWTFREFALIESRTLPEGSSYSVVASWILGGAARQRSRASQPSQPSQSSQPSQPSSERG